MNIYPYKSDWAESVIERLKSEHIDHHLYMEVFEELLARTAVRNDGEFIAFIGNNRIGKTTILKRIEEMFNPKNLAERMIYLPVLRIEIDNSGDDGKFDTKAFYEQALTALNHPIYGYTSNDPFDVHDVEIRLNRARVRNLRSSLIAAMKLLHTQIFIIDESQHFNYINRRTSDRAAAMLDSLKSLMGQVDCNIIVAGDYELIKVIQQSKHMVNRLSSVEYRRYDFQNDDDLIPFETILDFFSQGIKFENGVSSLRDWNQQIWYGSQGIVGNVSEWIRDAVSHMDKSGDIKLALKHIEATCPKQWDIDLNIAAQQIGEASFRGATNPLYKLRKKTKQGALKEETVKKDKPFQTKPDRRKIGGRLDVPNSVSEVS